MPSRTILTFTASRRQFIHRVGCTRLGLWMEDGLLQCCTDPIVNLAEMVGGNEWEAAFQKAKLLVGKMTLEEKVRQRDATRCGKLITTDSGLFFNAI